ncbi:hypothetical protein GCM10009742_19980 [Kribbella karoonensis]|uniref:Uncharacterized protein n=1 Tax=Kribbella karoonensis TaxID=324851 RepID=A0ABN2DIE5_9ACTN
MRPVPPCAAARRVRYAAPSAKASLQGSRVALPSAVGPERPMTAALVIAPRDPVPPFATAQRGQGPGSMVEPRELPTGAPWTVRLFTATPDVLLRDTSGPRPRLSGSCH